MAATVEYNFDFNLTVESILPVAKAAPTSPTG